jgi:hypothetical protein
VDQSTLDDDQYVLRGWLRSIAVAGRPYSQGWRDDDQKGRHLYAQGNFQVNKIDIK